jgi:hypothetical protein
MCSHMSMKSSCATRKHVYGFACMRNAAKMRNGASAGVVAIASVMQAVPSQAPATASQLPCDMR